MNLTRLAKLSFLVFVGCPGLVGTTQAQSLKVPYVSVSPTNGPLWIAKEARLFNKYNAPDVQLVYIPGGTVIIQSMIAGEANISNMAPPAALAAWVKGADFAVVGSAVNRLLETVVTSAQIKSPKELKGKRVGIGRYGSLTDAAFREALRYYSLVPDKEVTVIQAGAEGSRLAALIAGALDGAMLSGPERIQAEKLGFHVLIDFSKLPLEFPNNGIIVRKDFVRNNREAVKRFLKAWTEGIKIFKTDPELSLKVLSKYLRVKDQDVLAESYKPYPPIFERVPFPKRDGFVFALDRIAKELPEASKMNVDNFIDNSIIQELEKEGFIRDLYAEKPK
ncbi:MAG TPA: ABC transporter substrate-binding protein [Candidatus Acidoferrales bacterium]|nr:ABC transporter substrate-binding protein [Candidatus Acidoferrales bacterium]